MKTNTLTYSELSTFCLELSLFLHAGADSSSALVLLAEDCDNKEQREVFLQMAARMDEGLSLSAAMEESSLFPRDVFAMLRVGEESGRSEEALTALSRYYEQRASMERQLRSALLYPSLLMLLMLLVIVVLLTQVLPIFHDVYASLGGQLSGAAAGLFRLGQLLNSALPLLLVLLALAAAGLFAVSTVEPLRQRVLGLFRGKGKRGALAQRMERARFAQALSMALSSGFDPDAALETAAPLLENQDAVLLCRQKLEQGAAFAVALKEAELLPAAESRLLALGFASGSSEEAAAEIARRLSQDAETALEERIALIEPAMVVLASVLVGAILLCVMLPLTRIMSAMG